jgi:hypothetical protein
MRMAIVLMGQAEARIRDGSIWSVNWPGMLTTANAAAEAARLAKKDVPREFFESLQPELEKAAKEHPEVWCMLNPIVGLPVASQAQGDITQL